jgi:hypothetical protein
MPGPFGLFNRFAGVNDVSQQATAEFRGGRAEAADRPGGWPHLLKAKPKGLVHQVAESHIAFAAEAVERCGDVIIEG